ncbi:MAG: tetratricopeptide repeat protein [Bacteroidales bacterium]
MKSFLLFFIACTIIVISWPRAQATPTVSTPAETTVGYYMKKAAQAASQEQFLESIIFCTYALKTDSLHADAWYLRSYGYFSLGNLNQALSDINMALAISESGSYYLLKSKINFALRKYLDAWRDFNRARKIDPLISILSITGSVFSPILPGKK